MRTITVLIAISLAGALSCSATTNGELPVSGGSPLSSPIATAAYGIVRGPDANPVPGVMVNVTSLDDQAVPELAVITDDHGAYEWPLAPGRYRLLVTVEGIGSTTAKVAIIEGQRARVDLDLKR